MAKASKNTAFKALGIEYVDVGDDYVTGRIPMDERTVQPGFSLITAHSPEKRPNLSLRECWSLCRNVRFATRAAKLW